MKKPIFTGSAVAIITPFTQNDEVNFDKLGELIDFQINGGTDAIVICGTTGESSTLNDEEHQEAIRYTVKKVGGRVPVIAGTGSNDTKYSIELTRFAQEVGADAILSVSPYYNKTNQEGLYRHFKLIADAVSIPVIVYNVPSRTGINIAPETMQRLSEIENINAVKECNLAQMMDVAYACGDNLNIYSGNDNEVLPCLSYGGKGIISVIANVIPSDMHEMVTKYLNGDVSRATKMQIAVAGLCKALFCDVNPIPVKEACNMMGMDVGPLRLPLVGTGAKNLELIRTELQAYGLLK